VLASIGGVPCDIRSPNFATTASNSGGIIKKIARAVSETFDTSIALVALGGGNSLVIGGVLAVRLRKIFDIDFISCFDRVCFDKFCFSFLRVVIGYYFFYVILIIDGGNFFYILNIVAEGGAVVTDIVGTILIVMVWHSGNRARLKLVAFLVEGDFFVRVIVVREYYLFVGIVLVVVVFIVIVPVVFVILKIARLMMGRIRKQMQVFRHGGE